MSGPLGIVARAPRQSGLKKPRPLRSVSYQEKATCSNDDEVKTFQRQNSDVVTSTRGGVEEGELLPIGLCKEIAAMSAQVAHEAAQHADDAFSSKYKNLYTNQRQTVSSTTAPPGFLNIPRLSSSSSHRARDTFDNSARDSPSSSKTVLDCNSNNINTPPTSPQDIQELCSSMFSNNNYHDEEEHSVRSSHNRTPHPPSKRVVTIENIVSHKSSDLKLEIPKPNSSLNESMTSQSSVSSQSSHSGSISVATLMTEKGEDLVLTGRSMRIVLGAARVLVRETNSRVVRIEEISDSDAKLSRAKVVNQSSEELKSPMSEASEPESPRFVSIRTPEYPRFSTSTASKIETNREQTPPAKCHMPDHKYSKEELLELSRSPLACKTPAMWNILSITHSDVCVAGGKVKDYFDPDFFEFHDGSMVVDEYRHHQRRERHD